MLKLKLIALTALAVFSIHATANAQNKTKETENSSKVVMTSKLTNDPRLDTKVTYTAKAKSVQNVLTDLTNKTGVTFYAGLDKQDWRVRDRRVTIIVKDISLKVLMNSLSELLHFTWSQAKSGNNYTYRLFQDLKQREEEVAILNESDNKLADMRSSFLSGLGKLESLSPEELEKLQSDSPYMYFLAKTGLMPQLGKVLNASPDIASAFTDGANITVPIRNCSSETIEFTRALLENWRDLQSMWQVDTGDGNKYDSSVYNPLLEKLADARIKLSFHNPPDLGMFCSLIVEANGTQSMGIPLFDPSNESSKGTAQHLLKKAGLYSEQAKNNKSTSTLPIKQSAPLAVSVDPLRDPILSKEMALKCPLDAKLPDILEDIAMQTGIAVISDHFDGTDCASLVNREIKQLPDILRRLSNLVDKDISIDSGVLLLTDKQWVTKRSWEIPEEQLTYWQSVAVKTGFALDDLSAMAELSDDQLDHTIKSDDALNSAYWCVYHNKSFLRFYNVLSESQKSSLYTDDGLPVSNIRDDQLPNYQICMSDVDASVNNNDLVLRNSKSENPQIVSFCLFTKEAIEKYKEIKAKVAAVDDVAEKIRISAEMDKYRPVKNWILTINTPAVKRSYP